MNLEDLVVEIKEAIKKRPELRNDLIEIYRLAKAEIDEGESEVSEVEKALNSIEELIAED
jgi:hypothetical protein